jgi:hypothetical protein
METIKLRQLINELASEYPFVTEEQKQIVYEEYINSQKEKLLECSYNKLLPYIELRKNIRNEINEIMIYKDYLDAKQIDLLLQIKALQFAPYLL